MNISVGDRIKQRRIQLGIDADELANKIGKSRATVYRYENGDIENMPTTILEPLAKILNTTPAYLMGWDEEDPTIQDRDTDLENIEKILSIDGYVLCCESYDDDFFHIKDSSGKTVAGLYDYELLPRYDYLKKRGNVTAEMLISNSFILCPEEKDHINKYRGLDPHGKSHVDSVLNWESARVKELQRQKDRITKLEAAASTSPTVIELPSQPGTRHLVEYFRNVSAGSGIFILGNEAASRIAVADQDWDDRTDYVIRVNGDSMAPDYNDGDDVLVSQHIELRHGDVGIFIVNGSSFIKEYGENELISRNPAFQNIQVHEFDNIVCMGKVIGTIRGEYQVIND